MKSAVLAGSAGEQFRMELKTVEYGDDEGGRVEAREREKELAVGNEEGYRGPHPSREVLVGQQEQVKTQAPTQAPVQAPTQAQAGLSEESIANNADAMAPAKRRWWKLGGKKKAS